VAKGHVLLVSYTTYTVIATRADSTWTTAASEMWRD